MTTHKFAGFETGPKPFKKYRRIALIAGAVIAVVCHFVPPEYKAVCKALSAVCTGGI
jgi:hypothetical protein